MRSRIVRFCCIIVLASVFPAASRHDTFKQEMRFGAEAAQRGLWREAAFRWEKVVKNDPDNARAHNNLGVACENLGQFDRARQEYAAARRLAPESKEIRVNQESFQEFCRQAKICGEEPQASPTPAGEEPRPSASPDAAPPNS